MFKIQSLRSKLFLYLFVTFVLFTLVILGFQFQREKAFRKEQLENTLDNMAELTYRYIERKNIFKTEQWRQLDSIKGLIPKSERITIIDSIGVVLYDSDVTDFENMENHKYRPEIKRAFLSKSPGRNIRKSETTGIPYYYYAKYYDAFYVRVAVIYNIEVKNFLVAEKFFLFFIIAVFLIIWLILLLVTRKFGETITKLKDFMTKLNNSNEPIEHVNFNFPDDEFGIISHQIVNIYKDLKLTKDQLTVEKDKLFGHLNALNEGVAFFSSTKKNILTNNHFIQFVNIISKQSNITADRIFEVKELQPILKFIEEHLQSEENIHADKLPREEMEIKKNARYFVVRCIIYADRSFEIMITDITRLEKRSLLKQQMTSNISHELKTPVASVMGYMETLLGNNLDPAKKRYFIEKAYKQAIRLNELIDDISVLNKIEESTDHYTFGTINISEVVYEVSDNLHNRLVGKGIKLNIHIDPRLEINGNRSLMFSIFLNLMENAIKYAGEGIEIIISNYLEDNNYCYFSFRDTGKGIKEEHLTRIFERFYRIDTGRSRKTGGTGLGLAIVKNAIQLHMGDISVRNHPEGGLEFLFTLSK